MQRKVELATVFLVGGLVKPLPIGFPTVRAYVINDMVQIDQPPAKKLANAAGRERCMA